MGLLFIRNKSKNCRSFKLIIPLGEADLLRRAMGKKIKKNGKTKVVLFQALQKTNMTHKNLLIYSISWQKFAEYGLIKVTAAYGWVTYQTAWLKLTILLNL